MTTRPLATASPWWSSCAVAVQRHKSIARDSFHDVLIRTITVSLLDTGEEKRKRGVKLRGKWENDVDVHAPRNGYR